MSQSKKGRTQPGRHAIKAKQRKSRKQTSSHVNRDEDFASISPAVNVDEIAHLPEAQQLYYLLTHGFTKDQAQGMMDYIATAYPREYDEDDYWADDEDNADDEEFEDDGDSEPGEFEAIVLFKTKTPNFHAIDERVKNISFTTVEMDAGDELQTEEGGQPLFFDQPAIFVPLPEEVGYAVISIDEPLDADLGEVIADLSPFCANPLSLVREHRSTVTVSMTIPNPDIIVKYARYFVLLVDAVLQEKAATAVCQHTSLCAKDDYWAKAEATLTHQLFSAEPFVSLDVLAVEDDDIILCTDGCQTFGHPNMEIRHLTKDAVLQRAGELMAVATHSLWYHKTWTEGTVITCEALGGLDVTPLRVHFEPEDDDTDRLIMVLTPLVQEGDAAHA